MIPTNVSFLIFSGESTLGSLSSGNTSVVAPRLLIIQYRLRVPGSAIVPTLLALGFSPVKNKLTPPFGPSTTANRGPHKM